MMRYDIAKKQQDEAKFQTQYETKQKHVKEYIKSDQFYRRVYGKTKEEAEFDGWQRGNERHEESLTRQLPTLLDGTPALFGSQKAQTEQKWEREQRTQLLNRTAAKRMLRSKKLQICSSNDTSTSINFSLVFKAKKWIDLLNELRTRPSINTYSFTVEELLTATYQYACSMPITDTDRTAILHSMLNLVHPATWSAHIVVKDPLQLTIDQLDKLLVPIYEQELTLFQQQQKQSKQTLVAHHNVKLPQLTIHDNNAVPYSNDTHSASNDASPTCSSTFRPNLTQGRPTLQILHRYPGYPNENVNGHNFRSRDKERERGPWIDSRKHASTSIATRAFQGGGVLDVSKTTFQTQLKSELDVDVIPDRYAILEHIRKKHAQKRFEQSNSMTFLKHHINISSTHNHGVSMQSTGLDSMRHSDTKNIISGEIYPVTRTPFKTTTDVFTRKLNDTVPNRSLKSTDSSVVSNRLVKSTDNTTISNRPVKSPHMTSNRRGTGVQIHVSDKQSSQYSTASFSPTNDAHPFPRSLAYPTATLEIRPESGTDGKSPNDIFSRYVNTQSSPSQFSLRSTTPLRTTSNTTKTPNHFNRDSGSISIQSRSTNRHGSRGKRGISLRTGTKSSTNRSKTSLGGYTASNNSVNKWANVARSKSNMSGNMIHSTNDAWHLETAKFTTLVPQGYRINKDTLPSPIQRVLNESRRRSRTAMAKYG